VLTQDCAQAKKKEKKAIVLMNWKMI